MEVKEMLAKHLLSIKLKKVELIGQDKFINKTLDEVKDMLPKQYASFYS